MTQEEMAAWNASIGAKRASSTGVTTPTGVTTAKIDPNNVTKFNGTNWYSAQNASVIPAENLSNLSKYNAGDFGGGFEAGNGMTYIDTDAAKSMGLSASGIYNDSDLNTLGNYQASDSLNGGKTAGSFGQTLQGVGAGLSGLAALGSLYYADKNLKLAKDRDNWEKGQVVKQEGLQSKFASNVGGGASSIAG